MIETVLFVIVTLIAIVALVRALVLAAWVATHHARRRVNPDRVVDLRKAFGLAAAAVVVVVGLVVVSQLRAETPAILDASGKVPENSIAELVQVKLNGRKQWISIRGYDRRNPVLLFLAGGPGGTQLAAVRHELAGLEKHFVVVGWDQPGAGKSYGTIPIKNITVETYIEDGRALTEYLIERFGQEKIYLVGESWGSALGVFLVDRYPELYHAFVGTGQMVDFVETEQLDYEKAMELATRDGDAAMLRRLKANGMPPYCGGRVALRSAVYLNYLSRHMAQNPAIYNSGYNTIRDILSPEYGLLDKINFVRGMISTYGHVYPQLYGIDMREDYAELAVPVYFFEGRHDLNAPPALVEDYAAMLEAPEKELVWFEHSGHNPWMNERDRFVDELLIRFAADARQN
ncbi:MAG: alpha/beta hydrolase [Bacillota bacterium]|nr:alpha/beta hydrolase [Bacillota bacterium]